MAFLFFDIIESLFQLVGVVPRIELAGELHRLLTLPLLEIHVIGDAWLGFEVAWVLVDVVEEGRHAELVEQLKLGHQVCSFEL